MCRAPDDGGRPLRTASAVLNEYEDWVVRADETSLSELEFDALRRRYETFAGHREACDWLARE